MSKVYVFNLPNIFCVSCVQPLKNALVDYKEIKIERAVEDVVEKKIAIFVADDETQSDSDIKKKLLTLITDLGIDAEYDNSLFKYLIKGLTGVITGFALMAFMMSGVMIPSLLMYLLMGSSAALTLYLGAESYQDTFRNLFKSIPLTKDALFPSNKLNGLDLRTRLLSHLGAESFQEAFKNLIKPETLTMDSLFSLSTISVLCVSFASLFIPSLPMMLDAGLMIFGFRLVGRAIEESIKQHMVAGLKFRNRVPASIEVINDQDQVDPEKVAVSQIKKDHIILLHKGDVLPLDGYCLDETSSVYDTIISGSPLPRTIKRNELLLAGMVVPNHIESLRIRVNAIEEESFLARLDNKIAKANLEKAPLENSANKILQYFIPTVLGIAAVSGIIIGSLFNLSIAIQCAAAVLVSACPCTLGLITPLAVKIGLSKALEHGIQFKGGKALQDAQQIDTVVLDVHGTLTTGIPRVCKYNIETNQGITPHEFYQYLALLEQQSKHPIAASILDFIKQKNIETPKNVSLSQIDTSYHAGISALINDDHFIVGNAEMMKKNQINLDAYQTVQKENGDIIYLAKNGVILGHLILQDPLRSDAPETIEGLRRSGKKIHLCTGADQATANYYADLLHIPQENVYGNCTGSDVQANCRTKVQYIKQLQQQGKKVAMIGDAANDALALSTANFGIAVNSNAADTITQQEAGAIISKGALYPIVNVFTIAQQTVSNIKQNLIMSLAYNSVMLLLAGGLFVGLGFVLNPGLGVALMVLQTSLMLLNQYRFRQQVIQDRPPADLSEEKNPDSTYKHFNQTNLLSSNKRTIAPQPIPTVEVESIEQPSSTAILIPAPEVANTLRI